jgi:hypothetical protein
VLLTVVVLSAWAGWMHLNERRHRVSLVENEKKV